MTHGFYRAQVGEDGFEVVVRKILVDLEGHDRTQLARFNGARAHDFQIESFVVIRNAGRIRRNVGGGDGGQKWAQAQEYRAPGEIHARELPSFVLRGVAFAATSHVDKIGAVRHGVGVWREVENRRDHRLRHSINQVSHREGDFSRWKRVANRWNGVEINDDGCEVLVGHAPEKHVRHDGKKGAAVVADSFADGTS